MKHALFCLTLADLLISAGAAAGEDLVSEFQRPPEAARPWVYAISLNGNLTKAGLTADLEAMKRVGIGGVIYMEAGQGQGAPKGPATFGGPLWRKMFKHLCDESARLGLQVDMNCGPGWSGGGGAWITPKLSMQKLTMSETFVEGPKQLETTLARPPMVKNYYRDVCVLAFPAHPGEGTKMMDAAPKLTASFAVSNDDLQQLIDRTPAKKLALPLPAPGQSVWLQMEFPKPFTARLLHLSACAGKQAWSLYRTDGEVQVSDDGRAFKKVKAFRAPRPSANPGAEWLTLSLENVTARWFRIVFTSVFGPPLGGKKPTDLPLAKVELSPAFRLENITAKARITMAPFPEMKAAYATLPPETVIPPTQVLI